MRLHFFNGENMELVNKKDVLDILNSNRKKDEIINMINTMPTVNWYYKEPSIDCSAIVQRPTSYKYQYTMDYYYSEAKTWKYSGNDVIRWIPLFDIINIGEHNVIGSGQNIL